MPPLTYIHASEATRCRTCGGGIVGNASDKKPFVKVTCPTPLFGVWSPVGKHAPFVCIEPWYGRCDRVGFNQMLEEREYGNSLNPKDEFNSVYEITVC